VTTENRPPYRELVIERAQFGSRWPFTQPRALLRCYAGVWLTVVLDGQECALNGAASNRGFPSADPFRCRAYDDRSIRASLAQVLEVALSIGFSSRWSDKHVEQLVKQGHAPTPPRDDD
jgi:hypothetical protein